MFQSLLKLSFSVKLTTKRALPFSPSFSGSSYTTNAFAVSAFDSSSFNMLSVYAFPLASVIAISFASL